MVIWKFILLNIFKLHFILFFNKYIFINTFFYDCALAWVDVQFSFYSLIFYMVIYWVYMWPFIEFYDRTLIGPNCLITIQN